MAPTTEDVARIGLAAIKGLEAWTAIAEHHRVAVNDLAILTSLAASLRTTARNDSYSHHEIGVQAPTRPTAEVRRLLDRYRKVHAQGSAVISKFGTTLLTLSPAGSAISTETDLIVRRAAARGVPAPVAHAAADFPIPISEALKPPPVPTATQPRSATASAQAPPASLRTVRP